MVLESTPFRKKEFRQTAVEVQVWEGSLLRSRSNVAKTLCTYSLDNGPLNECGGGGLLFRFTCFDWEKNVRQLLTTDNVHFAVIRKVEVNTLEYLLKKKIYVAEDNPDILFALSTILKNAGYQVRESSYGKAILDGNYSWVDLFILDKKMPDMDGLEVCRHLRAQSATKDTPIIVISAQPRAGNEALLAGANDYIEKPFEMHYLLNVVSKYTRRQG